MISGSWQFFIEDIIVGICKNLSWSIIDYLCLYTGTGVILFHCLSNISQIICSRKIVQKVYLVSDHRQLTLWNWVEF